MFTSACTNDVACDILYFFSKFGHCWAFALVNRWAAGAMARNRPWILEINTERHYHVSRAYFRVEVFGSLHSLGDAPALKQVDGSYKWYRAGKLHRGDDRPAIVCSTSLSWYTDGAHCRTGPFPHYITVYGTKTWGNRSRADLPTLINRKSHIYWGGVAATRETVDAIVFGVASEAEYEHFCSGKHRILPQSLSAMANCGICASLCAKVYVLYDVTDKAGNISADDCAAIVRAEFEACEALYGE
jgi:hypothetical protein